MKDLVPYQLWRQDDNGNRFLVGEFTTREHAECRLAELMRCQHKQTYWISESTDSRETDTKGVYE